MSDDFKKLQVLPLDVRAEVQSNSVNAEQRTAEIVWTTGARVKRAGWFTEPFVEELSTDPAHVRMERLRSGAPFLANHDSSSVANVIGVVERADLKGGKGTATIRFSKRADADAIFQDIKDGILRNVSVGYRIHKMEKIGMEGDLPVLRAVDYEPHEISIVPIGADARAQVRSEIALNECVIRGFPQEGKKMSDEKKVGSDLPSTENEASRAAEVKAAAEQAVKAERERVSSILLAVRQGKLGDEFAQKMIDDRTSADEARAAVLAEISKRSNAQAPIEGSSVRAEITVDETDKWVRHGTAWLLERTGQLDKVLKAAKLFPREKRLQGVVEDSGDFRGTTLPDIAKESLERRGFRVRGMSKHDMMGKAFTYRAGGLATTSDFPVLLENTMHKVLLAAYLLQEDTWSKFMGVKSLSDFRSHNYYRTGTFGVLDSLSEHGEYLHKAIPDGSKVALSVSTKGNKIGFTRQMAINDDMGALSDLLAALGRAAKLSIEVSAYAELAKNAGLGPTMSDSQAFFHSNRANVTTGAALSVAALGLDRSAMRRQKDPSSNEYISIFPKVLLVPLELEDSAKVFNEAQFDPIDNKFQKPNTVRGLFSEVVGSPRLASNSTRRYLFADPNGATPAFVVTTLDGQLSPVLEAQESWDIDGTEMKVRLDYDVKPFDPKGAITNAGV